MNKFFTWTALIILTTVAGSAYAQLSGPTSATVGTTTTFFYDDGAVHNTLLWQVTGGTLIDHTVIEGTNYKADISFNTVGTQSVTAKSGTTILGSQNVSVSCPTLSAPNATISIVNHCGNSTISYSNSPPSGVTWYWQTSPSSFNTSLGSSTSLTVSSNGTYYLAANTSTCWSSSAQNVGTITINLVPTITATANQTVCGETVVTGTINSSVGGTTFNWTGSATGVNVSGSLTGTTSSFGGYMTTTGGTQGNVVYSITGTTAAGCQGTTSSTVTVNPVPALTISNNSPTVCSGNSSNISLGSWVSGTSYNWTATPSSVTGSGSGSGSSIVQSLSTTGGSNGSVTYNISATTPAGCGGSGSTSVNVNAPTTAGTLSVNQSTLCSSGSVTLSVSGNVGSVQSYMLRSQDNGGSWTSWSATSNTPSLSTPAGVTRVYQFQAFVQNGVCSQQGTNIVSTTVSPTSQGGTLSSSNGTSFCSSGTINLSLSGSTGNILGWYYQYNDGSGWSAWSQFSSLNSSTNSFAMSIGSTGSRSYQFYAQAQSGTCGAANSTTLGATVYQTTSAGTLAVNQTSLCSSGTVSLTVSGNTGSITRYMLSSQDNGGSWTTWSSTTGGPSLSTTAGINRTYQFQSFVQNGSCSEVGSNIVSTTVFANSTTGTLSATPTPICSSGTVTASASSLFTSSTQWQYRYSDNQGSSYSGWTTFSTIGTSPQAFSATSTTVDRLYQVQVIAQNGTCSSTTSNTFNVTANSNYGGTITPSALIEAYTSSSGNFAVTGNAGSFQKWQKYSLGTWGDAPLPNTSSTYNYTTLVSAQYRALISNGACSSFYSPTVSVVIYAVPVIQLTGATSPNVPIGGGALTLQVPNSYNTYQWVKGGTDVPGATNSTYQATEPAGYSVRVTSSATSPSATSAPFQVYEVGLQPDNTVSTVVTTVIKKAGVTPSTDVYTSLQPAEYAQVVQYLDPLSRPVQTVAIGQSPLQKDIVQPFSYDTLKPVAYLPYVAGTRDGSLRVTALTNGTYTSSDQYLFYQQSNAKVANSTAPYSQTVYEDSPLRRVVEQGAAGTDWQPGGHTVKPVFHTNSSTFGVRTWSPAGPTGYYASNTLSMNKTLDENGNPMITYSDIAGRAILKRVKTSNAPDTVTWLDTYYVYDTRGNLAMQVPPQASKMLNSGATWSTTFRNQWCFVYTYDVRNRIVQKQLPGSSATYLVYDPLGRLVLSQDGRLRTSNQWAFMKYDAKGRVVMTGIYTNASQTTLSNMQTLVSGLYPNPSDPYYEDRGTALHGYTNNTFPTQNADGSPVQVLSVNYFDNYDFDYDGNADYSYTNQGLSNENAQGNSFGFATGSKRLILGTSTWLYSYQFYDRFGRPIQARSNNHLSSAIDNLTTVVYDFSGKILQTKTYHNGGGTNQTTVLQTPTYDFQGRTLQVTHQINGGASQVVAAYQYNELGQLVMKRLHNTGGSSYMQNVDYRYNIRGWLMSINNAQLTNDSNVTNGDTNDYFGMELLYNTQDASLSNTPSYNGNITATKWKNGGVTSGAADERSFVYAYDKSDKLLTTAFQANNGAGWTKESGTLNETFSYDYNGNIVGLSRKRNQRGLSGTTITSTPQTIDNLIYSYTTGNRLSQVEDSGTTDGFNNTANNSTEYAYDSTGSVIKDDNKGIASITYNVLGNPQQITYSGTPTKTVTYTYDASGTKLKVVTFDGTNTVTIDYVGGFVYNNSALQFFSSPEGRVVKNGSNFEYQYSLTDHQGNTRVLFTSAAQSAQSASAGFETANQGTESGNFLNYPSGSHINTLSMNANSGSNSLYLNGGYSGQVGVAKSYPVYAGDQLSIQAHAKYNTPTSTSTDLTDFATTLIAAFNLSPPAPGETGTASAGLNVWGGMEAGGFGDGSSDNTDPKVFVNIVLFDKNYNFLDVAFAQLSTSGALMSASYTVKEAGYAYLYVSNENSTLVDVYFDDITMSYTPSNIIQSNEYYAHGLPTANSWTRSGAVANNFLSNGGTELNTMTGLMDLEFRNFDPVLGRMSQIDPMADKYSSHTPYNYAFNSPVTHNDINGADPGETGVSDVAYLFQQIARMGRNPYMNYHYDADHEDPGVGYYSNYADMFGDIQKDYQMGSLTETGFHPEEDAQKVQNGQMTQGEYLEKYGQGWNGTITVGRYTSSNFNGWTASIANGRVSGWSTWNIDAPNGWNGMLAQGDPLQRTPLNQADVNRLFRESFLKNFLPSANPGKPAGLGPDARDFIIDRLTNMSGNMLYENAPGDRTLGIVDISIYERDPSGINISSPVSIFSSPSDPLRPLFYTPGQTNVDHSYGYVNGDGSQYRVIVTWQEKVIN